MTSTANVPVLVDFLNSVPLTLTVVLVRLAPYISFVRYVAEILSWKSSWYDSWLALSALWAVCLLAEASLRYLLPVAIIFTIVVSKWTSYPRFSQPPVTEHNLQMTISDLTIIQSLIPPFPSTQLLPSVLTLFRVALIVYVPYLILTHLVPLRIVLGVVGSLLLSWRAPWLAALRSTLWRNAWVRWSVYHTWARLSGSSLPFQHLAVVEAPPAPPVSGNSLRFLFTIYENQRWWMGLDWTAALLPAERPSWCSASQHPVPPPMGFVLPTETSVYLKDSKENRVKRTAKWTWDEGEWRVIVRREGAGGLSRVERPLPSVAKEESPGLLMRAASKMKESTISGPSGNSGSTAADEVEDSEDERAEDELLTDPDGWVYGDNKWEGPSSRGGIGKYTRFRRWTRVAVVTEFVEIAHDGDAVGIESGRPVAPSVVTSPTEEKYDPTTNYTSSPTSDVKLTDVVVERKGTAKEEGSPNRLKQRLQTALHKSTLSSSS